MSRNPSHPLQLQTTPEEAARQRFTLAFKRQLESLRPRVAEYYQQQLAPALGAEPVRDSIVRALYGDHRYQSLCCLRRQAQQRMWRSVQQPLLRQREQLQLRAEAATRQPRGSLTLNPTTEIPPAMAQNAVHLQPGTYCKNSDGQDLDAGVLYEAGGAIYSQGQRVGTAESKADMVIRHLRQQFPDFHPHSIVDLACSAGASTLPYALAFPGAVVHGVDIAPGMLRYAHAKAEALGLAVHFQQQNVNALSFEDSSVDLVVSHNALHELSSADRQAMFAESWRILKPGGICVHQDVPLRFAGLSPFWQAEYSFDQWFNGEAFWSDYAESDCLEQFRQAGFSTGTEQFWSQSDQTFKWYILLGQKPVAA